MWYFIQNRFYAIALLFAAVTVFHGCEQNKSVPKESIDILQPTSQDSGEAIAAEDQQDTVIITADDPVVIPQPITGSYLYCSDSSNQASQEAVQSYTVNCGVMDEITASPVDLAAIAITSDWKIEGLSPELTAKAKIVLLQDHKSWQVEFLFDEVSIVEKDLVKNEATFAVYLKKSDTEIGYAKSMVKPSSMSWVSINGGKLPATGTFLAGSEQGETVQLYLCRLYKDGAILPGKIREHYEDPDKSICYSTEGDQAFESHSKDATTLLYNSDVLIVDETEAADKFSWVDASQGDIPPGAVAAGKTALGAPIYFCRNIEEGPPEIAGVLEQSPGGEQTPGSIAPGDGVCTHEYFGVRTSANYQVLVRQLK